MNLQRGHGRIVPPFELECINISNVGSWAARWADARSHVKLGCHICEQRWQNGRWQTGQSYWLALRVFSTKRAKLQFG